MTNPYSPRKELENVLTEYDWIIKVIPNKELNTEQKAYQKLEEVFKELTELKSDHLEKVLNQLDNLLDSFAQVVEFNEATEEES